MQLKDIQPGQFVKVRHQKSGGVYPTETVRVERIAEPRYEGDKRRVVVSRLLVKGLTEARFAPRDVLEVIEPDERMQRIVRIIEGDTHATDR